MFYTDHGQINRNQSYTILITSVLHTLIHREVTRTHSLGLIHTTSAINFRISHIYVVYIANWRLLVNIIQKHLIRFVYTYTNFLTILLIQL